MTTDTLFVAIRRLAAPAAFAALIGAAPQGAAAEDLPVCDERDPVVCELSRGAGAYFGESAELNPFAAYADDAADTVLVDGHAIPTWAFDDSFALDAPDSPAWAWDATFDLDAPRQDGATVVVAR